MSSGGASRCPCCWKPSPFRRAAATIRNPPRQDRTPYIAIRGIIARIALESGGAYGSPRIWLALRNRGIRVSEKAAACLMGQDRIEVLYTRRKRVCSSYIGEMTPAVENLVCGNFHAPRPDMLWSTDITEFSAGDAKVYLSPITDCYDGRVVSWSTSRHPDSDLVEKMPDDVMGSVDPGRRAALKRRDGTKSPTIHADRGGRYRGGSWIERLGGLGITRSMKRRGGTAATTRRARASPEG